MKKIVFCVVAVVVLLGCFMLSSKEVSFQTAKLQVFDGRQQVPTDKPTGMVTVKGKLY